ncbi:hypothetical protein ABZW38_32865 [Streptomyces bacillaris]
MAQPQARTDRDRCGLALFMSKELVNKATLFVLLLLLPSGPH